MPKADTELVKMIIQRHAVDLPTTSAIIEDILAELQATDEEEKVPPVKKQFVVMVSDPNGELEGKDFVGWVLQIPEEDSPQTAEGRLFRAAYEYNITPRGRRLPVRTIAEVCEHVSARYLKEQGVSVRTKEPVYILRTGGKVPMDEIKKMRRRNEDQADDHTVYDDGVHAIRVGGGDAEEGSDAR